MLASFKQTKYCDKASIYLTNGYIHEAQQLFPWKEISYYTIPELVIHICLSFYFDKGVFKTDKHGANLSFSDDNKTVEKVTKSGISLCSMGDTSISSESCDIFIIEYLLDLEKAKSYCPYIGYFMGEKLPQNMKFSECYFLSDKNLRKFDR